MESIVTPENIKKVVDNLKSNGTFDRVRRECLSDVDTKPSYRNLIQRVEGCLSKFLSRQTWRNDLNKSQLRNQLRCEINSSEVLMKGVKHLVDQVISEKTTKEFKDEIESFLNDHFGIKNENEQQEQQQELEPAQEQFEENINNHVEDMDIDEDSQDSFPQPSPQQQQIFFHVPKQEDSNTFDGLEMQPSTLETSDYADANIPQSHPNESETTGGDNINENVKTEQLEATNREEVVPENDADSFENISLPSLEDFTSEENVDLQEKEEEEVVVKEEEEVPETKFNQYNDEPTTHVKEEIKFDEEEDKKDQDSGSSDISSVHTSDLSDFDDEISLDGSAEEDNNEVSKTKISLKVAKKIYEGNIRPAAFSSIDDSNNEDTNSEKATKSKKKAKSEDSAEDEQPAKKVKANSGKATSSNAPNKPGPSQQSSSKPKLKRTNSKQQRYDSSDLYKPRLSLSRRHRSNLDQQSTPESNSANDD